MTLIRNIAASFLIIGVIVSLFSMAWIGFETGYGIPADDDKSGRNIMESLEDLSLIQAINEFSDAIYRIAAPDNVLDLLGALASAALAIIKSIGSIVLLPIQLFAVVSNFYPVGIPGPVEELLGGMPSLIFAYILISAYLRHDI